MIEPTGMACDTLETPPTRAPRPPEFYAHAPRRVAPIEPIVVRRNAETDLGHNRVSICDITVARLRWLERPAL